jgi:hypothetical protein
VPAPAMELRPARRAHGTRPPTADTQLRPQLFPGRTTHGTPPSREYSVEQPRARASRYSADFRANAAGSGPARPRVAPVPWPRGLDADRCRI